jgi:hypothetical protein
MARHGEQVTVRSRRTIADRTWWVEAKAATSSQIELSRAEESIIYMAIQTVAAVPTS